MRMSRHQNTGKIRNCESIYTKIWAKIQVIGNDSNKSKLH
jgi:hypothetical protein